MNSRLKKTLIIAIGAVSFFILGVFVLNGVIENKLKNRLEHISKNVKIQYESIEVNSLKGNVHLVKPQISVYGKTTHEVNAQIELEHFLVNGFGYWDYFFNDKISIDDILFNQPKITYYHNDVVKSSSYEEAFKNGFKQMIQIESMEIHDGQVEVRNVSNDSLMLMTGSLNLKIEGIELDQSASKKAIAYKDFEMTSKNTFYQLNAYENLFLEQVDFHPDFSKLKGFRIRTKYSKETLSKIIPVERDHFDLSIDSIEIKKQDFGVKQDSLFYFKSERVDFYQPDFKIYRDKLVADDLSYKPLYSKTLRDLNFRMTLNLVFLNNASIVYTEKVKADTQGGRLLFSKLNAEIKNLSNTYKADKADKAVTSANIKAVFMDNTSIKTQWDFDVNNVNDEFVFKAEIGKLNANSMNQFMEPNLNVRLKGEINKTYFTINGNDRISHIDLKLQYDDFDVLVLKENGKEKNKFLSSIINIFVSKDSNDASGDFRYGSKSDVERTDYKSVFNYLWLNIKAGLLNAMTGDGKKNKND